MIYKYLKKIVALIEINIKCFKISSNKIKITMNIQ